MSIVPHGVKLITEKRDKFIQDSMILDVILNHFKTTLWLHTAPKQAAQLFQLTEAQWLIFMHCSLRIWKQILHVLKINN
jgi:ribonuclease BN (tRNA processing enzyme)